MTDTRYQHRSHVGANIISKLWNSRHDEAARELLRAALNAEKSRRAISRYRKAQEAA